MGEVPGYGTKIVDLEDNLFVPPIKDMPNLGGVYSKSPKKAVLWESE